MNGVTSIQGEAVFTAPKTVEVTKPDGVRETMTPDAVIIAAGSGNAVPPIPGKESLCQAAGAWLAGMAGAGRDRPGGGRRDRAGVCLRLLRFRNKGHRRGGAEADAAHARRGNYGGRREKHEKDGRRFPS